MSSPFPHAHADSISALLLGLYRLDAAQLAGFFRDNIKHGFSVVIRDSATGRLERVLDDRVADMEGAWAGLIAAHTDDDEVLLNFDDPNEGIAFRMAYC